MRRIWAHKISFSVSCPRDTAYLAQARLSRWSGFAQVGPPLLTLITIFGRLRRSLRNASTLAEGPRVSPIYKNGQNVPHFGPNSLYVFVLLFFRLGDLERSLFSKSPAYTSHKHASYCLALSLSTYLTYLDNKLRSRMEMELKTSDLAKSVI